MFALRPKPIYGANLRPRFGDMTAKTTESLLKLINVWYQIFWRAFKQPSQYINFFERNVDLPSLDLANITSIYPSIVR
ncbi:hypothetical protein A8B84_14865 [Marinobacter sp. EhC06]|nr:hypothetical protein A8B80_09570 [Marinobacter sp. EhN04]OAN87645.1 hypothetical protein A8B84_14865 [Marinobacter sp. EhC06]